MMTPIEKKVFKNVDWQKMLAGMGTSRNITGFPTPLRGKDFSGWLFEGCKFDWAVFRECNFANAAFNCVSFVGSQLSNCDFSGASFANCIMDRAVFQSCSLAGTKMIGVTASDSVDFVNCVLPKGKDSWARSFGIYSQMEKKGFEPGKLFQRNHNGSILAAAMKGVVFPPSQQQQDFFGFLKPSTSAFFVATLEDLWADFFLSESGEPLYIPFSKETKEADKFLEFYNNVSE